ncbi:hypothetical protein A2U01_0019199, partial [Trifolium medium]|nr:hypothetical protein [Trifolium medium]
GDGGGGQIRSEWFYRWWWRLTTMMGVDGG